MEPDGRTWYLMVCFFWNLGMNFNPNIFGTQKIESWWKLYSNPYYFDGDVEWCRYLTHPVTFYPFGKVIHPKGVGISFYVGFTQTNRSKSVAVTVSLIKSSDVGFTRWANIDVNPAYIYIWMFTCRRDWHSLPSVQPRILLSGFILSKVICDSFLTIKKYYDNSMNTG